MGTISKALTFLGNINHRHWHLLSPPGARHCSKHQYVLKTAKSQTPLKPSGGTGQIEAQRNVPAKFPGG